MSEHRPPRYLKPMNKFMMAVQKLGIPTGPAMVLTVPGRKTGKPRSTPMTPFEHDIAVPPVEQPWGMREFVLRLSAGHQLVVTGPA